MIGYTDRSEYVNVTGIRYTADGPAAVVETRDDFDPRQW